LLAVAALALPACGGDEEEEPANAPAVEQEPPQAESTDSIAIEDFEFLPPSATVTPGTRVTWRNDDTAAHTASSEDGGLFDTGGIDRGKTGSATARDEPGTYEYICEFHPTMHGTLIVE
jgi:plastocyanin